MLLDKDTVQTDSKIEQYNQDVNEYILYKDKLTSLETEKKSIEENMLNFYWKLCWLIFAIFLAYRIILKKDLEDFFISLFLGGIVWAYLSTFIIYFIYNDTTNNFFSHGELNRLKDEIKKTEKLKEDIYKKLYEFESRIRDYYQNKLEEFYGNYLYKKRSGTKLFEESLSEFSRMIDELSKINSRFIATHIYLQGYEDYLSKRKIDHSFQTSKQSDELKSIHNFVKRITVSNQQKQKIVLPPEKIYKTVQKINNWEEINKKRRITGLKGEEIAVAMEQEFLNKINRKDLSERVRHSSVEIGDSLGYDVLSFFEDGREKYIEVKSTTTTMDSPYYISRNELEFLKTHSENAFIYRFLVSGNIPQVKVYSSPEVLEMNEIIPTQYIVNLK